MGYGSGDRKKKIAIIVVSSVLLVAMIGAVTYSSLRKDEESPAPAAGQVRSSTKAIQSVCAPTQYKHTCVKSLASANTSDPQELIKVAFKYAQTTIADVISKSDLIQQASKDPRTQGALNVCKEVLNSAIEDFKRSADKIGEFDINKIDTYAQDLKVWLSGTVTYQETCIDAFHNTTGNAAEKMKAFLKTSSELASNAIAMVSGVADVLSQLSFKTAGRRLLETSEDGIPLFVDAARRRLLFEQGVTSHINAVVSQTGAGQFTTINDAIRTVPKNNDKPFIIFVMAGVYNEYVEIPKRVNHVILVGEGPTKTKITGNKNFIDGVNTFRTATVVVNGDYFMARDIGIENSAGAEKHQAVALRASGDYGVYFNVQLDGYQDTLYAHTYRQFYSNCTITGTIDFVFGDAAAIFQNCKFIVRKPLENQNCMVTAQGRKDPQSVGVIVLQNCTIVPDPAYTAANLNSKAYLGRPWKEFSRTIIMSSYIDSFIDAEGWAPWMGTFAFDTCYYGEYQNRGLGAATDRRVTWKGIQTITPEIAESFTPIHYFKNDSFITFHRIRYTPGMIHMPYFTPAVAPAVAPAVPPAATPERAVLVTSAAAPERGVVVTPAPVSVTPAAAPVRGVSVTPVASVTPTAAPVSVTPAATPVSVTPATAPVSVTPVATPERGVSVTPAATPVSVTPAAAPVRGVSITPAAAPQKGVEVTPAAAPATGVSVTPAAAPERGVSVRGVLGYLIKRNPLHIH